MVSGEQDSYRLTEQDLKAMGLVDELKYLLLDRSPLDVFESDLVEAYQLQGGEPDQVLLNNVLGLMVRNGMIKNQDILRAVGAAINLKQSELKLMIKAIQDKVAVNPSGQ